MRALTFGMAGAALLAFGVAKAGGDRATDTAPAGYVIVDPDAHIPESQSLTGFDMVDDDHLLIRAGARDLYMAQFYGDCVREARYRPAIGVEGRGDGGVDRFSNLIINGRRCPILALVKVVRMENKSAAAASLSGDI
ncbi:MAG TPA: DUF6491 family protein [Caulobacterales bacterium]|nr:DUF6491 family protein [Caulobacterales bacterium]